MQASSSPQKYAPHLNSFINVMIKMYGFECFFNQTFTQPPHPDFDASREKLQVEFAKYNNNKNTITPYLQRLGEAESGQLTKEEFNKMKQVCHLTRLISLSKQKHQIQFSTLQELEAEYLATFKKTVAQHEVLKLQPQCDDLIIKPLVIMSE